MAPDTTDYLTDLKALFTANWRSLVGGGYVAVPALAIRDDFLVFVNTRPPCILIKPYDGDVEDLSDDLEYKTIPIDCEIIIFCHDKSAATRLATRVAVQNHYNEANYVLKNFVHANFESNKPGGRLIWVGLQGIKYSAIFTVNVRVLRDYSS